MTIQKKIIERTGSQEFVYSYEECKWYSYDAFWVRAIRLADEIKHWNVGKIVAVLENGIQLFLLYFACMLSNTTIIPIDPHKAGEEIKDVLKGHPDSKIIKEQEADALWKRECGRVSAFSITDFRKRIETIDFHKTYMITYTSGSTGIAKGVKHSLGNLFLTAGAFAKVTNLNSSYMMCHCMPMTYMAGILNTIMMPFISGCRIVLFPRFDVISAVSFWKKAQGFGINAFWFSPTMLKILMTVDRKGSGKEYLAGKKPLFYVGTAPLFDDVRGKFEHKYGVKLLQSYGLSETLFLSTELMSEGCDHSSVGFVLPDVDIKIADDGEIKVRVPWMFQGYYNEETSDYFDGNYYLTGDLGKIEKGRLYITGRKKDLIIKGGMNISPRQIEDCIVNLDVVEECSVSGVVVDNEECIVCWYVPFNNSLQTGIINSEIEKKLGKHCRIDYFRQIDQVPKNLNGKADKKKLVEGFRYDSKI